MSDIVCIPGIPFLVMNARGSIVCVHPPDMAAWEQVSSFTYNNIPVHQYKSKSSGLSVVLAQVSGIERD